MKPFSALYYIKENKSKVFVCIFMIVLTAGLYIMGNFVASTEWSFRKEYEYSNKLVLVGALSTDEDFNDYLQFLQQVKDDPNLKCVERSAKGFGNMTHNTTLGFDMGGSAYVFNSKEDMQAVFEHLGIDCDFSRIKDGSLVISKDFANNRGVKPGDVLDYSFDSAFNGEYPVDAIIDDGSYTCFYLVEDDASLLRMYIYSDTMEGDVLHDYVRALAGDKKVHISGSFQDYVKSQFEMFYAIFYVVVIIISVIMAVTVNSVVTGFYMKRTYEFGIYRALGMSKKDVIKKCASEILVMDLIGFVIGMVVALLATYLINELAFNPNGIYLLYYSKVAFVGYLLCNILIVIPLIISKSRSCCKADVTEF